jgi:hypothetical protein
LRVGASRARLPCSGQRESVARCGPCSAAAQPLMASQQQKQQQPPMALFSSQPTQRLPLGALRLCWGGRTPRRRVPRRRL